MKIRNGFVSNSSSTSFLISNKTDKTLTVYDLAVEVQYLVEEFNKEYNYNYTIEEFLSSAGSRANENFGPHEIRTISFGDEEGTVIGNILDYMLRDTGSSPSFHWQFHHFER